jgi:hypothetical protein
LQTRAPAADRLAAGAQRRFLGAAPFFDLGGAAFTPTFFCFFAFFAALGGRHAA